MDARLTFRIDAETKRLFRAYLAERGVSVQETLGAHVRELLNVATKEGAMPRAGESPVNHTEPRVVRPKKHGPGTHAADQGCECEFCLDMSPPELRPGSLRFKEKR